MDENSSSFKAFLKFYFLRKDLGGFTIGERYRITFEFEDEVDADDERDALVQSTSDIAEVIGMNAVVERIKDEN